MVNRGAGTVSVCAGRNVCGVLITHVHTAPGHVARYKRAECHVLCHWHMRSSQLHSAVLQQHLLLDTPTPSPALALLHCCRGCCRCTVVISAASVLAGAAAANPSLGSCKP
jgi:hypothetical protein